MKIIARSKFKQTPAEFAFRFLYNRYEICCVLSGMSSLEQVVENIEFAGYDHRNTLNDKELNLYQEAKAIYRSRTIINCTGCEYCVDCPQHIPIPFIFEIYNDAYRYEAREESKRLYNLFIKPEHRADKCNECGGCEQICPQKIEIIKELKKVRHFLKNI